MIHAWRLPGVPLPGGNPAFWGRPAPETGITRPEDVMRELGPGLTRRDFLRDTAAVSAGVAALGGLPPARILGANDRIRLGVLGAGQRGNYVMTVFAGNPDVEVVAVCDVY